MKMFCTELHGDFLKWIVMREIHRGATLYFFVSSLKFYSHDCHPERSRRLMKMFYTELYRVFLHWIVLIELEKGKGDFSNGKDISKSCKK